MISKTFAEIEKEKGIQYSVNSDDLEYSLVHWYDSVRNKEFSKFDINDLCISIRQHWHPEFEYLYPYIYENLKQDINAGEKYEGEMLVSLKAIEKGFWEKHKDMKKEILELIENNYDDINNFFIDDVNRLLDKLRK